MKGLSQGAKIFAVILTVMALLFLVIIFLNSSTYVSSPVYRRDPLIGNYSFIASSGAAPMTADNATYVVAYVDLNLAEVRPGDGFSLYVPMNKGSCVYKSFYGDPVVDVTVANTTLFYNGSAWLLNFTARVTVPSVNCYGTAGGLFDMENATRTLSCFHVGPHTYLYVDVVPVNSTVLKMCFSVLPSYCPFAYGG